MKQFLFMLSIACLYAHAGKKIPVKFKNKTWYSYKIKTKKHTFELDSSDYETFNIRPGEITIKVYKYTNNEKPSRITTLTAEITQDDACITFYLKNDILRIHSSRSDSSEESEEYSYSYSLEDSEGTSEEEIPLMFELEL